MTKLLVAVRGPQDLDTIQRGVDQARRAHAELAVCQVLVGASGPPSGLFAEQRLTAFLREHLAAEAEEIAVFVVSGRPADDVDACALRWGADEVLRWDDLDDDVT